MEQNSTSGLAAGSRPINQPQRLAYGISEAAAVSGLGRTTLYGLIRAGELASCKIGKRRIIQADDLQALLDRARLAAA